MSKQFVPLPLGPHPGSKWTILEYLGPRRGPRQTYRFYRCRCECGTEKEIVHGNLAGGLSHGCQECSGWKNKNKTYQHVPWSVAWANSVYCNMQADGMPWKSRKEWWEAFGQFRTPEKPHYRRHDTSLPHSLENSYWSSESYQRAKSKASKARALALLVELGATEAEALRRIRGISRQRLYQIIAKGKRRCEKCGKPWGHPAANKESTLCYDCRPNDKGLNIGSLMWKAQCAERRLQKALAKQRQESVEFQEWALSASTG